MKITCYRTTAYKAADTYTVAGVIHGNLEPENMDDETRAYLANGSETMCAFTDSEGITHFVPWPFVISIEA